MLAPRQWSPLRENQGRSGTRTHRNDRQLDQCDRLDQQDASVDEARVNQARANVSKSFYGWERDTLSFIFSSVQFPFLTFHLSNRYEHIMKAAKERKQDQIETGQSKAGGVLV